MFSLKRIWHDFLAHQLPEDQQIKKLKEKKKLGTKTGGQTQGSGDVVTKPSKCSTKTGIIWRIKVERQD
jgi:hypothetical protein